MPPQQRLKLVDMSGSNTGQLLVDAVTGKWFAETVLRPE
jgi:hypothetical protein